MKSRFDVLDRAGMWVDNYHAKMMVISIAKSSKSCQHALIMIVGGPRVCIQFEENTCHRPNDGEHVRRGGGAADPYRHRVEGRERRTEGELTGC